MGVVVIVVLIFVELVPHNVGKEVEMVRGHLYRCPYMYALKTRILAREKISKLYLSL